MVVYCSEADWGVWKRTGQNILTVVFSKMWVKRVTHTPKYKRTTWTNKGVLVVLLLCFVKRYKKPSRLGRQENQQLSNGGRISLQSWLLRSAVEYSSSLRRYSGCELYRHYRSGMRYRCSPEPAGEWQNQIQADCRDSQTEQLQSWPRKSPPNVLTIRYADEEGCVKRESLWLQLTP